MKYIANCCILFSILVALLFSKDSEYKEKCNNRLDCYNSCNKAFFPSLFCQETDDFEIHIQGNIYHKFFKYPDPNFVLRHETDLSSCGFDDMKDDPKCKDYKDELTEM